MSLEQARPVLEFIAKYESKGDLNAVWGGIRKKDRPKRPLTEMTVREVLAWQDWADPHYMSEASGKWQIMEDTLRGLYREAGVSLDDVYDEETQSRLAYALLKRRGWNEYLTGHITANKFCNSLAKEWASLPVVSGPKVGRSYYAGDGLNKAHASVEDFTKVVINARDLKPVRIPQQSIFAHIIEFLLSLFARNRK